MRFDRSSVLDLRAHGFTVILLAPFAYVFGCIREFSRSLVSQVAYESLKQVEMCLVSGMFGITLLCSIFEVQPGIRERLEMISYMARFCCIKFSSSQP